MTSFHWCLSGQCDTSNCPTLTLPMRAKRGKDESFSNVCVDVQVILLSPGETKDDVETRVETQECLNFRLNYRTFGSGEI